MIIWSGKGYLGVVFVFGCSLAANLLTNAATGSGAYWDAHRWLFGVSLMVAGVLCWVVGLRLREGSKRTLVDPQSGENVIIDQGHHSLFFVRMHYWGPILEVAALIVIIVDLLK